MSDILVINLERNPERMRAFQQANPHLQQAKRFSAVDGRTIDRAELIRRQWFAEPIIYTDGAIGNALSHMRAWEQVAAGSAFATVVEDDAILHKDFEVLAPPLIASLPPDWDLVLWGWNFDTVLSFDVFPGTACAVHFSQSDLRARLASIQTGAVQPALHRLHYAFGTVGYSLSPAGAKKLLQEALPIKPFLYKIPAFDLEVQNDAMDCVLASLYDRINAYVSFPPLGFTKNDSTVSTVQAGPVTRAEHSLSLLPTDFFSSRKFKRKFARALIREGDYLGGARWYLKYLATGRKAGRG